MFTPEEGVVVHSGDQGEMRVHASREASSEHFSVPDAVYHQFCFFGVEGCPSACVLDVFVGFSSSFLLAIVVASFWRFVKYVSSVLRVLCGVRDFPIAVSSLI